MLLTTCGKLQIIMLTMGEMENLSQAGTGEEADSVTKL